MAITVKDGDLFVILGNFHMDYSPNMPSDYKEYLLSWLNKYFTNVGGWGFPIRKKYCPKPMTLKQFEESKEFEW